MLEGGHGQGPVRVAISGREVWAYVVELADGLRLQASTVDWERMGLVEGQRIPVRLPGRADVWLYVPSVTSSRPSSGSRWSGG